MLTVYPLTQAETPTAFTSGDTFTIPDTNGTVRFLDNGTYTKATLNGNVWSFENLILNNSQAVRYLGFTELRSIENLNISTKNANITIQAFLSFNYSMPVNLLNYNAEGSGEQTINFCLNTTEPADVAEWSVIVKDNVFLAEGDGWTLQPDNTLIISGQTGNVTIVHYNFSGSSGLGEVFFVMQHYMLIVTGVVLAAVIMFAVAAQFRAQRKKRQLS